MAHDPYGALRSAGFRWYSAGNFVSVLGRQMVAIATGLEVFRRTHSATALGLLGLAGALPVILFALPAGQVADRFSRRGIILISQVLGMFASLLLAWLFWPGLALPAWLSWPAATQALLGVAAMFKERGAIQYGPEVPLILILIFFGATARTFGWAARSPFIINLVSRGQYANAVTWNSSLFEIGCITGPAIGGLLLGWHELPVVRRALTGFLQVGQEVSLVCALDALSALLFVACVACVRASGRPEAAATTDHPVRELFSGLGFVWRNQAILATITLDLFAVLLGGATALLPIFSDQILGTGAIGLGWLRGAQSMGAIVMAITLAHRPPLQQAGRTLLWAVAVFGGAMVVFGLSRSFWLSLAALAVAGAADNVSVVVRHTLVQVLTPDHMRGRVAAVNNVFIGSSNELGALESGLTAARFGPVLSVVGGGIGTILSVLGIAWRWPELRRLGTLQPPAEPAAKADDLPPPQP